MAQFDAAIDAARRAVRRRSLAALVDGRACRGDAPKFSDALHARNDVLVESVIVEAGAARDDGADDAGRLRPQRLA